MKWTLPNILTVLRLVSAPALGLAFVAFPRPVADWIVLGLFVGAALTDWLDGYLARRWDQTSRLGAMLDPIADKAMVIIALALVIGLSGLDPWLLIPGTVILFREVFVSGLREYLGSQAGQLSVTKLAKWKTTAQMAAISILLLGFALSEEHHWTLHQMTAADYEAALAAGPDDWNAVWRSLQAASLAALAGAAMFWVAAVLTAVTGWDYFKKSLMFLGGKQS